MVCVGLYLICLPTKFCFWKDTVLSLKCNSLGYNYCTSTYIIIRIRKNLWCRFKLVFKCSCPSPLNHHWVKKKNFTRKLWKIGNQFTWEHAKIMWAIWLIGFLIFSHRVAVDMNVIAVRKMTVLCKQFKHLEVITIPFFIYHSECSIFLDLHIETEVLIVLLLDFVKVTWRCNELFLFTLSLSLSHV